VPIRLGGFVVEPMPQFGNSDGRGSNSKLFNSTAEIESVDDQKKTLGFSIGLFAENQLSKNTFSHMEARIGQITNKRDLKQIDQDASIANVKDYVTTTHVSPTIGASDYMSNRFSVAFEIAYEFRIKKSELEASFNNTIVEANELEEQINRSKSTIMLRYLF